MRPAIGDIIDGYCGGLFGRDSYDEKRVEAVGSDWIVVRENGRPGYAGPLSTDDWSTIMGNVRPLG